jgi:hypothetical protein
MARMLALLVVLGGLALGVASILHGIDEASGPDHSPADLTFVWVISALAVAGAGLLGVGTLQWYGQTPQTFRAAGFVALLIAALGVVSFAFVLLPLVLLAVPALFERTRAS